jgi:hypothetical protein
MASRLALLFAAAATLAAPAPARAQTFTGKYEFDDTAGNPVTNFSIAAAGAATDTPLGEEGGLADPAGGAERGDGLAGPLPGGDRVPPELVSATASAGLRHGSGLLV